MQVPAITGSREGGKQLLMQVSAGERKFGAAGLLQVGLTDGAVDHGPRPLLSVREAARLLGVCTATVYKLCADGKLPQARILNAIRIVPADLAAFVMTRRRAP
jgi:excisionase family DNA binding protein